MNTINYSGKMVDSDNNNNQLVPYNSSNSSDQTQYKNVDLFSIKNAYQAMIIQKTMEAHELISSYLRMTHPLTKMTLAFMLLNPYQTFTLAKTYSVHMYSFGMFLGRSIKAFVYRKPQPVKKTFEISYIVDNSINHLYVAFDWYLKSNSKVKKNENHAVLSMVKPIEASKKNKDYPVLKTVPEEQETEFVYDNYTFNYSKSSHDDVIYAPSGEIKKKNYKLLIWSYYCGTDTFDNLSTHVINAYAKSKVDEVWVQKIYEHAQGMWKDFVLDRNKRKISSVVMKGSRNQEISELLNHFTQTEEWHLERGIPYKKSFLFYGPPGTGKSSMIKAISFELQRHIHYLSLSTIKNDQELSNLMSNVNFKETILVIEDIDAQGSFVHKRPKKQDTKNTNTTANESKQSNPTNDVNSDTSDLIMLSKLMTSVKSDNTDKDSEQESKSQLTLSGILNQIDGVHNNHGMILIMTTNYPELLDEALIRDGRVDERVFFDYCDYEQIYLMFKNFYNGNSVSLETIKSKIDLSEYTVAPCNVENSMRRYFSNQIAALDDIVNSIKGKKTFEKFEF
jgi:chaperone BCS1